MILSGKKLFIYRLNKAKETIAIAATTFVSVVSVIAMMIAF